MTTSRRHHVVVVGAGVAGLAAAHFLTRSRDGDHLRGPAVIRVTVLEGSARIGGKLLVSEVAGLPVDAGAEDFSVDGDFVEVLTEPTHLDDVRRTLEASGAQVTSAEVAMVPKAQLELPVDQTTAVVRLVEKLEDLDDVTRVYTNVHISDEVLAQATAS